MEYITGNLLEAKTDALVNTVNTVGVMGKGIALQFKERFPINYKIYVSECKAGKVKIGKMLVVKELTLEGEKLIINFPTKTEWYKKSQYSFINEGLEDLVKVIGEYKIKSIAIPPLGSGNGGLKWDKVKVLMNQYLENISDTEILIYEPNAEVKRLLERQNEKSVELRPGRAMLLYAMFEYEKHGEIASVFAANKLAYFLQKGGEPLRLDFVPYKYGPYSQAIDKVLYALNGKYLNGLEQMNARAFEPLKLNYQTYPEVEEYIRKNLNAEQHTRLKNLFELISGFESSLALEILSSVDYLLAENPKRGIDELLSQIQLWNDRKRLLINRDQVEAAVARLNQYSTKLQIN
jgi:O-acetyl-ADP-ribose deacetylase (regulator of RNase III)